MNLWMMSYIYQNMNKRCTFRHERSEGYGKVLFKLGYIISLKFPDRRHIDSHFPSEFNICLFVCVCVFVHACMNLVRAFMVWCDSVVPNVQWYLMLIDSALLLVTSWALVEGLAISLWNYHLVTSPESKQGKSFHIWLEPMIISLPFLSFFFIVYLCTSFSISPVFTILWNLSKSIHVSYP